jgi:hypothetical protein
MEAIPVRRRWGGVSRFAVVPEELFLDETLDAREKMLLCALFFHRNQKTGECYPGIPRLSRCTGLSIRTVNRVLLSLEKKDRIKRKRRYTRFGDYDTNSYFIRGWCQTDATWCQSDATWCQSDATVASEWRDGWRQVGAQTENLNKEDKQKKPSTLKGVLEPKPKPNRAAIRAGEIRAAFSEFWNLYPKKQGKKAALAEFEKIFPADLETDRLNQRLSNLYGQLVQYVDSVQGTEAKYVKFPANWLKSIDPDEAATIEEEVWVRVEEAE